HHHQDRDRDPPELRPDCRADSRRRRRARHRWRGAGGRIALRASGRPKRSDDRALRLASVMSSAVRGVARLRGMTGSAGRSRRPLGVAAPVCFGYLFFGQARGERMRRLVLIVGFSGANTVTKAGLADVAFTLDRQLVWGPIPSADELNAFFAPLTDQ